MFSDCQPVEEDVVLGADPEAMSDLVHVGPDVITVDDCCTSRWCEQTWRERERETRLILLPKI